MHIAFLDASKAFDRINRRKLLSKLESRGIVKYILRLLSYEFHNQHNLYVFDGCLLAQIILLRVME